jgi:HlyD family secretion protein
MNWSSAAPSIGISGSSSTVTSIPKEKPVQTQPQLSRSASSRRAVGRYALPLAALEFGSPSAAIIAKPISRLTRATNLFVFLLVASLLAASGLIRVDKIVTASGKLVADAPNIVMQPFDQTIVESIGVKKGDIVRKGQVLARLNPTFSAADATTLKDQVDLLSAQAERQEALSADKPYTPTSSNPHADLQLSLFNQQSGEYQFSLQNFDQKINQLKTQITGNETQAAYYQERLGLATTIEAMRQKLQSLEVGSTLNTLLAKDVRLTMQASLSQAESDAAQANRELAAAQAERQAFIEHWNGTNSEELADTRRKLVEAQQEYSKASLHNRLVVLTAPRDAVVLSVAQVSAGSVVTAGESLIELVPLEAPLSVEADISGTDSGYVHPGDKVTIKFETLPFLQYGSAHGVVRTISGDSFNPETVPPGDGSTLPNRPHSLYYKGDISLDTLMLHDTPPGFRLVPGMPLTVDVKVGARSILAYFVDKVMPVATDSIREP